MLRGGAVVLLAAVAALVAAQLPPPLVSFQIHSYDDLREWAQVLRKGATWLKVDFNFQTQQFCQTQTRVPDPSRGCYVLNHDPPTTSRTDYNTSSDVLEIVADPNLKPYFANPNQRVFIALCAKYLASAGGICDGSAAANDALAVMDDFVTKANALVSAQQLNVEFILDGSFSLPDCVKQRWRPWVATWIVGQNAPAAAESNNATEGYDRFQINNMPEGIPADGWLEIMQAIGYGKFQNDIHYPFLFWEPSDQASLMAVTTRYATHGTPHTPNPGLRFAINIDPVQLQVYTSRTAGADATATADKPVVSTGPGYGGAWNVPLLAGASQPFVAVDDARGVMFVLATSAADGALHASAYALAGADTGAPGAVTLLVTSSALNASGNVTSFSAVATQRAGPFAGFETALIVGFSDGAASAYGATTASGSTPVITTDPLAVWTLTTPDAASTSVLSARPFGEGGNSWMAAQAYGNSSCALWLQMWMLYADGGGQTSASPLAEPQCVVAGGASSIASASVSFMPPSATTGTAAGLVAYGTSAGEVYAAAFTFAGRLQVSAPGFVGVGTSPSVSVSAQRYAAAEVVGDDSADEAPETAATLVALLVMGDAHCWNNEVDNKRATPALCDSTPTSRPYVLSYTFGTLAQWRAQLSLPSATLGVSPCSDLLLHGTYDWGSHPCVALYGFAPSNGDAVLGVAAVHDGTPTGLPDPGDCGAPLPYDGVVLDGWPLPTPFL